MVKIEKVIRQTLKNCDISDAAHAGMYSICGLALRLRDLYKWENKLEPWVEKDSGEILEWIGHKEDLWEKVIDQPYELLSLNGEMVDPFDVDLINEFLAPTGLMYGAGYAQGLKPTFFVAKIQEERYVEGQKVFILGEEYARDMLTLPALCQGGSVLFRRDSARIYFWDQLFYMKKSGRNFLNFALNKFGINKPEPKHLRQKLDFLLNRYQDAYIYHEIGEIKDVDFGRNLWRKIIRDYPRSIVEFFARTTKDLLSDLNDHGTLKRIARERDEFSLALYAAFIGGLAGTLFPELRTAVDKFIRSRDWRVIETAMERGYASARRNKNMIIDLYRRGECGKGRKWVEQQVENHLKNLCKISPGVT